MLTEFSFPKKGKNNSNFWMVNLCHSGTKDFAELWEIIHLNSVNLKHYSQTCLNEHLCKTMNAESAQANSCSIVTSNATSNHVFNSQMKKTCLKQQLQNFTQGKNVKKT